MTQRPSGADEFNLFLTEWVNGQIATAVKAERERCAKIAAEAIAAIIRIPPAGPGDG